MARKRQTNASAGPPSGPADARKTPLGTDQALTLTTSSGSLCLSYWDLWFALIAVAEHDGSLDALGARLMGQDHRTSRSDDERKFSHLRDLQQRLLAAGVTAQEVVAAAGPLASSQRRLARGRVLEHTERQYERSEPMRHTWKERRRQHALRGFWDRFPVCPYPTGRLRP